MNRYQLDRLRRIVATLEIAFRNNEVIGLESQFQFECGFGPGNGITITESIKSEVYEKVVRSNHEMAADCEKELIALVAELIDQP